MKTSPDSNSYSNNLNVKPVFYSSDDERVFLSYERTRLASERTFLSWIRTGLTGIGIGIAIARLIVFQQAEHQLIANWIGLLMVVWGIAIFIFALISYQYSYKKLGLTGGYQSSIVGITLIVFILVALSIGLFWLLL